MSHIRNITLKRSCVLIDSFLQKCLASTYIEEEEARIVPLYIQFV